MAYNIEKDGNIVMYKISGFFTYQDMSALIQHFDSMADQEPNAKLLVDFSKEKGLEEETIKMAYERIEKGFPKKIKIALVFSPEGVYKYITNIINLAMRYNSRAFDNIEAAKKWLLSEDS